MTQRRQDPMAVHMFYLTITGMFENIVFRECSGVGSESDVIEYKAAGKKDYLTIAAIPGRLKWQKIALKRGITDSGEAWTWRKMVEDGNVEKARKNGSLMMVAQDGTILAQWDFINAWPSKISGPSFNSGSNEVGVEELEVVHEGLKRVKPGGGDLG
jgi:phage tail-like protein